MSVLFAMSFRDDDTVNDRFDTVVGPPPVDTTGPSRHAGDTFNVIQWDRDFSAYFGVDVDSAYIAVGLAMNVDSVHHHAGEFLQVWRSATELATVRINESMQVELRILGVLVHTGTETAGSNEWRHIVLIVDTSADTVELWENNNLTYATATTEGLGAGNVTETRLAFNTGSSGQELQFQDFWIDDAESLGDARVVPLDPDGVGNSEQWVPDSLANNWQEVSAEAGKVTSDVLNDLDLHTLANLPTDAGRPDVKAVTLTIRGDQTDTSTRNVTPKIRSGTTNYDGTQTSLLGGVQVTDIWNTNPDTTSDWTKSDVDALEAGYEAT